METNRKTDPLKDIINASYLESPPDGFTASVMKRLPAPAPFVLKPVITLKGWIMVAGSVIFMLVLGFSSSNQTGTSFLNSLLDKFPDPFPSEWFASSVITSLMLPAALAILLLFLIDSKFNTQRHS